MTQEPDIHAQIVGDYESLEPGETDRWSPVGNFFELSYRLSLFYALTIAIERSGLPPRSLKVLDIGCGNGRSTRVYVDLSARPEQVTGIDFRKGAITLAQALQPAINFVHYEQAALPFPDQSFNWIAITTVVSSIKEQTARQGLFDEIYRKLVPGGFLFYFDLVRANPFAGRDRIYPLRYTQQFETIWHAPLRSYHFIPASHRRSRWLHLLRTQTRQRLKIELRSSISQIIRPSHEALLVRKPV